jgi:hypothetical protein
LAFGGGMISGWVAWCGVECTKLHVHQNLGKWNASLEAAA